MSLLSGQAAAGDPGPYIEQMTVTAYDSHGSPTNTAVPGGQVSVDFLVANVQRGAELEVYAHLESHDSTRSHRLGGISLAEDAWLTGTFSIPSDASGDALGIGIEIRGRYWPTTVVRSKLLGRTAHAAAPAVLIVAPIAWKQIALWAAIGTTAVITAGLIVESVPAEWPYWDTSQKGSWREENARRRLEKCGWDLLDSNVEWWNSTTNKKYTEIDHVVAKDGVGVLGESRGSDGTSSSKSSIEKKASRFGVVKRHHQATGFMWVRHATADGKQRSLSLVKANVATYAKRAGFAVAWLLDMTDDDCPTPLRLP